MIFERGLGDAVAPPEWQPRAADIAQSFAELERRVLPSNVQADEVCQNAARYVFRLRGVVLAAIVGVECIEGTLWAHLSVSAQKPARVPNWDEFGWAKQTFLGDRKAVLVLPPKAEYVNHHPHVLHLFAALERDPLPDFRKQLPDGSRSL